MNTRRKTCRRLFRPATKFTSTPLTFSPFVLHEKKTRPLGTYLIKVHVTYSEWKYEAFLASH